MSMQVPVAEGGRPSGGGGLSSHWMLIGGIAGVGVLAVLLMKGSSSSGTTAAGTSINAALGSIQEQNLNLMGQLGASTAALSQQATDFNNSELAATTGMQTALSSQIAAVDGDVTSGDSALSTQLGDVNNNVVANGQAVAGLGTNLTQYYNNLMTAGASGQATTTNWLQQLANMLTGVSGQVSGVSGQVAGSQSNIATWLSQVASQITGVSGQVAGVSNQVTGVNNAVTGVANQDSTTQSDLSALGNFLSWEFYQLPNRYAAYIPGQGPSNMGASPLASGLF
jgi:hypothetical protein